MQKTLILTFELCPEIDQRQKWSVLDEAQKHLVARTLACSREGNKLIGKHIHKNWNRHNGPKTCYENTFWNIPLEGMKFTNISAEYTNAFLPSPEPDFMGNFEWWNGESRWFPGPNNQLVILTCLPSREMISLSMDIKFGTKYEDMDIQRKAFLEIGWKIENMLKLTQTTRRLVGAFEVNPPNPGRIRRFKNKLFLEIAKI